MRSRWGVVALLLRTSLAGGEVISPQPSAGAVALR